MAEMVFQMLVRRMGCEDRFTSISRATSREEIGNPIYPPALAELKRHGVPCHAHAATQLKKSDYRQYDLFVCMDDYNLRNTYQIFTEDPQHKVKKLLNYTDRHGNVADPWYTDRFDIAYRDILDGCCALLKHLLENEQQ